MNQSYDQLLDHSKELILVVDALGNIGFTNRTARISFGLQPDEKKNLVHLISNKNYFNVVERLLSAANNSFLDEVVFLRTDRQEFYGSIRVVYLDDTGSSRGFFITDLTYRYQFRKEITDKVKVIELLSKSAKVRGADITEALNEILAKCVTALEVTRVNVWMLDPEFSRLHCIGSYSEENGIPVYSEMKEQEIRRSTHTRYFQMLETEDVIATDDVMNDPQTSELHEYLQRHKITSMLDIPLRSDGKMNGVICFEHTGTMRRWTIFEIKFGFLIAQAVSLLMEGFEKTKLMKKQQRLLREKEKLMHEISFRSKYSFTLVNAFLNYYSEQYRDSYHPELFAEMKNQIQGISGIHEIIFEANDYSRIRFSKYIFRIMGLVEALFPSRENVEPNVQAQDIYLPISKALPLAMVLNELLKLSYTQSFNGVSHPRVSVFLSKTATHVNLRYHDNGMEYNEDLLRKGNLSVNLVEFFVKDLGGTVNMELREGNKFSIQFPV